MSAEAAAGRRISGDSKRRIVRQNVVLFMPALRMAIVTGCRIISISADFAVVSVRLSPAVAGQATEHLEITAIGVAGRTVIARMSARGDREPDVIEPGPVPGRIGSPMAGLAGRRESRGDMVRVTGRLVIRPVAAVAIAGRPRINVVLVTGRAIQSPMHSLEWVDAAVTEIRLVPVSIGGSVANLTGGGKTGR